MKPSQVLLDAADLMERRPFLPRSRARRSVCAFLALIEVCPDPADGRHAAQEALKKEIGRPSIICWNDGQEDKATVIAALRRAVRHLAPDPEIRNAIIEKVSLTIDGHGMLTAWLHLDYGGARQDFGGHMLYAPKLADNTGRFIWRCLETVGVTEWANLEGRGVRARVEAGLVAAIGHFIKDRWFEPGKELA